MAENPHFLIAEYAACFSFGWLWVVKRGNGNKKTAEYK
jgi:hypothetical protein